VSSFARLNAARGVRSLLPTIRAYTRIGVGFRRSTHEPRLATLCLAAAVTSGHRSSRTDSQEVAGPRSPGARPCLAHSFPPSSRCCATPTRNGPRATDRWLPAPQLSPDGPRQGSTPVDHRRLVPRAGRCLWAFRRQVARLTCPGLPVRIPSGTPGSLIASQGLANDSEHSRRLSPFGCNDAVQHGELLHCFYLHSHLFALPPLPLLTDRGGVPTLPHSHYLHNVVAVVARFCYWSRGGLRTYFRRIPCSTICARS